MNPPQIGVLPTPAFLSLIAAIVLILRTTKRNRK